MCFLFQYKVDPAPMEAYKYPTEEKIVGLHFRGDFSYYGSSQQLTNGAFLHYVRRECRTGGPDKYLTGFRGVQGIATDSLENLYVVDSWKNRVLKFDKNFKFMAKYTELYTPFGILVIEEKNSTKRHVMVCDTNRNRIVVLNDDMQYEGEINNIPNPFDITKQDGLYFVAAQREIMTLDIQFNGSDIMSTKIGNTIITQNVFRSICSCKVNGITQLYITERYGKILYMKYQNNKLVLIDELPHLSPIVIATNGEKIFYSYRMQGNNSDPKFCVRELGNKKDD